MKSVETGRTLAREGTVLPVNAGRSRLRHPRNGENDLSRGTSFAWLEKDKEAPSQPQSSDQCQDPTADTQGPEARTSRQRRQGAWTSTTTKKDSSARDSVVKLVDDLGSPSSSLSREVTLFRERSEVFKRALQGLIHEVNPGEVDEEEYDTDLDDSDGERSSMTSACFSQTAYETTCRRLGVLTFRSVLHGLHSNDIVVRGRSMTAIETLALCSGVLTSRTLERLSLDDNNLGGVGAEYLAFTLSDEDSNIKQLMLSNNGIGSTGVQALGEMMLVNQTLVHLDISGNCLKDTDARHIAAILKQNKTLRSLDISHNSFGDEACRILGPVLAGNDYLRVLDLSWNKIRPFGAMRLFRKLKDNVMLKTLNLSMNGAGLQGATGAAVALLTNRSLTELDLSYNRVNDDGVLMIAKALQKNECLRIMKLQNNPITTNGALALLNSLKKNSNTNLHLLDISSVPVTTGTIAVLAEIQQNHGIRIKHGAMISTGYKTVKPVIDAVQAKKPIGILVDYMDAEGLRGREFFNMLASEGSFRITHKSILAALKKLPEIPLTSAQVEEIVKELDSDKDGEIDFGDFGKGEREYRKYQRKMKVQERRRQEEQERQKAAGSDSD